jgi:hypothetical protein
MRKTTGSRAFRKIFSSPITKRIVLGLFVAAALLHILTKLWFGPAYVEMRVEQSILKSLSGPVRVGEIEFNYDGVMFIRDVSYYDSASREVMKASGIRLVLGNWPSLDAPAKRIEVERLDVRLRLEGAKPIIPLRQEKISQSRPSYLEYFVIKNATVIAEVNESQMAFDGFFAEVTKVEGIYQLNISRKKNDGRFQLEGTVNPENQQTDINLMFAQVFNREQMKVLLSKLSNQTAWGCAGKVSGNLSIRGNLSDAETLWPQGTVTFKDWTIFVNYNVIGREFGAELLVDKRHLNLERVAGVPFDGRLKGSFFADVNQSGPVVYEGNVLVKEVNLAELTETAETEKRFTRGTGLLNIRFTADTSGVKSIKAEGAAFFHDADLWRFPLIGELFKSIGIWEYRLAGMSDAEIVFRLSGPEMTIERGHLSNRFSAIEAEPGGKINLQNQQIDLYVVAAPLKTIDRIAAGIPIVKWFASFKNKLIRLRLKGQWSEPATRLIKKQPLKDIKEGTIDFIASVVDGGGQFTEKLLSGFGLTFDSANGKSNNR